MTRPAPRTLFICCAIVAVMVGGLAAISRSWLCDDAFISFRYAEHLVDGHGLVFNAGERVEGDTNFLWTLWCAVGLELGVAPGPWAIAWGVACFAASLVLLSVGSWRIARDGGAAWAVPMATVCAALHVDWTVFATSGLETSAFTLAAFGGYMLAASAPFSGSRFSNDGYRRLAAAGAVYGVAALIRPDGPVFVAICGLWLLGHRDLRAVVMFAAGYLLVWAPPTVWRVVYYGDLFPNTYYAKSASLAWWSQGLYYAETYFTRYWPLLLALPASLLARSRRLVTLEIALASGYALYVMRIGGDFMFARMLIPITPYPLLAIERALVGTWPARPLFRASAAGGIAIALVATPSPLVGRRPGAGGVVDERSYYTAVVADWASTSDDTGRRLRPLFADLPIVVCFFGSEARLVYESHVRGAIECEAGLTDETIAHQPLVARGRIGHEKHAPWWYVRDRGVHFAFKADASGFLGLDRRLPAVYADLHGVRARMLFWDAAIVAQLRARGARIPDVPAWIDREIAALPSLSDTEARDRWEKLYTFYFAHVDDPARERPFRARLAGKP